MEKYMLNNIKIIGIFAICMIFSTVVKAKTTGNVVIKPQSYLSQEEIKVWNDPAFRKRFAESYLSETDIEPKINDRERKQMMKVLDLISMDNMDAAAKELEGTVDESLSAVFDFTLGNVYFQTEQLDKAIEPYKNAVAKFPKFRRAWKNLGLVYIRLEQYFEASEALSEFISLGGGDSLTYGLLGFAYSATNNSISAESAYRMATLLDPKTLDWKMGLAKSFFKQERFGEAVALCDQLIEQYPDRSDLWMLQANAYIGQGKASKAAEVFELIDHLGKSTADSLNMLGDIYVNEELYSMAANAYVKSIILAPDKGLERAIRSAKILAARAANDETKLLISKIQELYSGTMTDETKKDILKLRARLAVAEGAGGEEVQVLREIVEIDPLDGEALILLGQNSYRNGDDEKAIFYYERAAGIDGFEADAKLYHGQLLVKLGRYKEALPLLRRTQTIDPRENVQKYIDQVERIAKTH